MKQFTPIKNNSYTFSNCNSCEARCCDGKLGSVFSQVILSDFEENYKNFPILFTFGDLGYLKPVIILSNGVDFCKYIENHKCTIYDKRPSICRAYPLSINIDNQVYIDTFCPAINDKKEDFKLITKSSKVQKDFDNKIFYEYQDKYIKTFYEFESFNKKEDFTLAITLKGMNFFKYNKSSTNKYMKMHLESLKHLEHSYFKDLN
jgi:Fe-S-cluster containining protein